MQKFIIVCKECEHGNEISLAATGRTIEYQDLFVTGKITCAVCGAEEKILLDDEMEG